MGYNTRYKLTWETQPGYNPSPNCRHESPPGAKFCVVCGASVGFKPLSEVIARQILLCEEATYCLMPDGSPAESGKWYEHETDMRVFSKEIPEVLFTLHGEGDENGDIWKKYFLNGKCQVAKAVIQFLPFDKSKLQ